MVVAVERGEGPHSVTTNAPWIPGDDIVVSAGQIVYEVAVAKDKVNTGSTRTPYGTSEWGSFSEKR